MDLGKERKIFGKLGSISLADIVQLLGVNKRTATLELDNDGDRGTIFFKDGIIVHASNGSVEGEDAILHILEWPDASFVIEEGIPTLPKVTMAGDAEALMLRLCSKLDELRRDQPERHKRRKKRVRFSLSFNNETKRRRFSIPVVLGILAGIVALSVLIPGLFMGNSKAPMANPVSEEPNTDSVEDDSGRSPTDLENPSVPASNGADSNLTDDEKVTSTSESPVARVVEQQVAAPDPSPPIQPSPTTVPAQPAYGFLLVVAEPWAEVTIDGEKVGETPMGRIRLSAGEHTISLLNENFAGLITGRVSIPADETITRKYSFNEAGYLQVVVQPWADVFVDGRLVGQTPLQKVRIPVGRHSVTLRHPQLGEKTAEIDIKLEETTLLRMEM
jgi:hypothetical protein